MKHSTAYIVHRHIEATIPTAHRWSIAKLAKTAIVITVLVLFSIVLTACDQTTSPGNDTELPETSEYDASVASAWFGLSLELIEQTAGFSPPVASRALSYMGATLYETVTPGIPGYRSLAGELNGLEPLTQPGAEIHWPAAANSALAEITRKLFRSAEPDLLQAIDALEETLNGQFKLHADDGVFNRSVEYGREVAGEIYNWSQSDGGHQGFTTNFPDNYTPPEGPGMWIPTPPNYQTALQPYWGENRPFALSKANECSVTPPPAYSEDPESVFYAESLEVYETVGQLSDEQREIALFWSDDPGKTSTPPGHWISILNQVISEHNHSLDTAAEAYARLGIALADAFIVCWYEKYHYDLIRPISYIQQVIDPGWNDPEITDPVFTPPFPEYPSGHSVQSGAAAVVLTDLFGEVSFTDLTHETRGLAPRSFASFWEAAEEAVISRLYGGIHYRAGIEFGVEHGRCIGEKVAVLELK
jgi:predicted small secreted protein